MSEGLRTRGLRRRVVGAALLLTGVSMVTVALVLTLTLGDRLRAGIRADLEERAQAAMELDGAVRPREVVRRVAGDGVSARLQPPMKGVARDGVVAVDVSGVFTIVDGAVAVAGPTSKPADGAAEPAVPVDAPLARAVPDADGETPGDTAPGLLPLAAVLPAQQVTSSGGRLTLTQVLPATGSRLTLSTSTSLVGTATSDVLRTLLLVGLGVLAVGAVVMSRLVGLTLRPLDSMAALAASIARGERGGRLRPDRVDTEMGRAAAAFDEMLESLETAIAEATDARDRLSHFLADASHELRTPIAAMTVTAETILRGADDRAATEELAVRLVQEGRRATRLVDDLTATARLDGAAGVSLHRETLDLRGIVADAADRGRAQHAREIGVALPDAPAVASCDPGRILQVLANLLDNAARWSPDGALDVTLSVSGPTVVVHVDDHGPGVPAHERERIFERLVRLQDDRSRATGGSGLGLAISRDIARAHGGDLVCEQGTHGARFTLTLPAASPAA